jgi:hypothetical protein
MLYLVTNFIYVPHIVGSVFGPIRFLLPACRFCWFLCTFNIHLYMHIFRNILLSNYWRQESDIWSQTSYRYAILWEAFLDPSDSYFLFAKFVDFYTHWTYMLIFRRIFSATIDGRNLIFGHKLHICTPYRGKRFWTHQIPTSCLPTLLICIHIEHICSFFVTFFSGNIDDRIVIFGHKLHIGMPYCGKRFWTRQIPTSCLPTLLIVILIEHISWFFVTFSQQLLMADIWYLVTSFI